MRVSQVCPRFYPDIGGVETHVYEISRRLAEDFEVEVLTTDPTGKLPKVEEFDSILVRRFKSFAPNNAYYFSLDLYNYLKKNSSRYDIVHAHNYHALPSLFTAMTIKSKFIFTPHYHAFGHSFFRNLLHKPYRLIGKKIFERAEAVICVSEYEKNLVLKNFKIDESKIYVIPNGVNIEEFKNVEKIKRQESKDIKIILFVGRIEWYKGLDYVVKALKYLPDDFVLEVVGKGNYKQKIFDLAKKLRVLDRIRFYQDLSRKELIERYAKADVLVLLSRYEAYGLVVAEALASKTPCIVANESALKEWIDNRNVFGVDHPADVKELSELILKVSDVEVDVDEVKDAGKLMSWDNVVEMIRNVYGGG